MLMAGSLGDLPLIVISHGSRVVFGQKDLEDGWARLQKTLTGLSTDSVHVVATDSGHLIPWDQPELVVEAIRQVEAAARSNSAVAPCSASFADVGGKCLTQWPSGWPGDQCKLAPMSAPSSRPTSPRNVRRTGQLARAERARLPVHLTDVFRSICLEQVRSFPRESCLRRTPYTPSP